MTPRFIYFSLAIMLMTWGSCTEAPKPITAAVVDSTTPPYTIQLQEFVNPNLPGLHSYIHAVWKDKIIMIGGRINGMHPDYNFDQTYANTNIYVVDTKNWSDPTTWATFSMPHKNILGVNRTQFRSNNAQYFQNGNTLYIVGGLEYANVPTQLKSHNGPTLLELVSTKKTQDGAAPHGPITQPLMTAINMDVLVDAVMNNKTVSPPNVRQAQDSMLAITGGELETIGNTVYLVFGWNFSLAGDAYSHQIRSFNYTDDGTTLSLGPITVCPTCFDGVTDPKSNAGNFRRRDGSMSVFTDPSDGSPALMYYSGVFKNGNTNFNTGVFIHPDRAAELPDSMFWNVYTCQVVPVHSASRKTSYASLLGGMTYKSFTGAPITQPTLLTAANTKTIPSIPITNRFTTVVMPANGRLLQYLLPDSFPPIKTPLILPAVGDSIPAATLPVGSVTYNGAESEMHWTIADNLTQNGVINYDAFIAANPNGGTVAYLHGGIEADQPNVLNFGNPGFPLHHSVASKRLFAVKIVPTK